jgi:hypothetical protein
MTVVRSQKTTFVSDRIEKKYRQMEQSEETEM